MLRRLKILETFVLAVMCIAAIVALVALVQQILPYEPITIHSTQVESGEACSNSSLKVYVDYSIDEELYSGIRSVQVKSDWVAVDVPNLDAGTRRAAADQPLDVSLLTPGRREGDGRVLRISPQREGVWSLETELTVRGKNQYGLPAVQTVYSTADEDTTISDSSC